jgi:L-asparagine transporter-like permease
MEAVSTTTLRIFAAPATPILSKIVTKGLPALRSIPRAINQVVYRILIFYIGAISVMLCLFPWNQIGKAGSPFVTIFDKIGVAGAANILNVLD